MLRKWLITRYSGKKWQKKKNKKNNANFKAFAKT